MTDEVIKKAPAKKKAAPKKKAPAPIVPKVIEVIAEPAPDVEVVVKDETAPEVVEVESVPVQEENPVKAVEIADPKVVSPDRELEGFVRWWKTIGVKMLRNGKSKSRIYIAAAVQSGNSYPEAYNHFKPGNDIAENCEIIFNLDK